MPDAGDLFVVLVGCGGGGRGWRSERRADKTEQVEIEFSFFEFSFLDWIVSAV